MSWSPGYSVVAELRVAFTWKCVGVVVLAGTMKGGALLEDVPASIRPSNASADARMIRDLRRMTLRGPVQGVSGETDLLSIRRLRGFCWRTGRNHRFIVRTGCQAIRCGRGLHPKQSLQVLR